MSQLSILARISSGVVDTLAERIRRLPFWLIHLRADAAEAGTTAEVTVITPTATYAIDVEVTSTSTAQVEAEAALAGFRLGLQMGAAAHA